MATQDGASTAEKRAAEERKRKQKLEDERRKREQKLADEARKRREKEEDEGRKRAQKEGDGERKKVDEYLKTHEVEWTDGVWKTRDRKIKQVEGDAAREWELLKDVILNPMTPKHLRDRAIHSARRVIENRNREVMRVEGERVRQLNELGNFRMDAARSAAVEARRSAGRFGTAGLVSGRATVSDEKYLDAVKRERARGAQEVGRRSMSRGDRARAAEHAIDMYEQEQRDQKLLDFAAKDGGRYMPALDVGEVRAAPARQRARDERMRPPATRGMGWGQAAGFAGHGISSPEIDAAMAGGMADQQLDRAQGGAPVGGPAELGASDAMGGGQDPLRGLIEEGPVPGMGEGPLDLFPMTRASGRAPSPFTVRPPDEFVGPPAPEKKPKRKMYPVDYLIPGRRKELGY